MPDPSDPYGGTLPPGGAPAAATPPAADPAPTDTPPAAADDGRTPGDSLGTDPNAPAGGPETNANASPGVPYTLPADPSVYTSARSAASFNALGLKTAQPIVQPPVKIWKGHQTTWGQLGGPGYFMRPPGSRGPSKILNSDDNWDANGCHPTCLAMILDWWQFKNEAAHKSLTFPFPTDPIGPYNIPQYEAPPAPTTAAPTALEPEGINPLVMCRRLFGQPYVPAVPKPVKQGYFDVDHLTLQYSVVPSTVTTSRNSGNAGVTCTLNGTVWPMQTVTYGSWSGPDNLKAALRFLLELGPVMIQLFRPAHFVVVRGFRNNVMYICDPGNIIDAIDGKVPGLYHEWIGLGSSKNQNGEKEVTVKCDASSTYDYVLKTFTKTDYDADTAKLTAQYPNGVATPAPGDHVQFILKSQSWLSNIRTVEGYYFDDNAVHPEWSDPAKSDPCK